MKYAKGISIAIVIMTIMAIIVGCFLFVSGAILLFDRKPPKPAIEHGEFPFKLTYEVDGEEKIIEDTIICDYDGMINYGGTWHRKWESNLESGNQHIILLDLSSEKFLDCQGRPIQELFLPRISASYYMGDSKIIYTEEEVIDEIGYTYLELDGTTGAYYMNATEAEEKFQIKLVSWECAEPIQNTFSD